MTTHTTYRIFNSFSNSFGQLYGGLTSDALERALIEAQTQRGDRVELQQVEYEMVQQGERMIAGSTIFEPRMVRKETNVKVVRAGVVTKHSLAAGYRIDNQPIAAWVS